MHKFIKPTRATLKEKILQMDLSRMMLIIAGVVWYLLALPIFYPRSLFQNPNLTLDLTIQLVDCLRREVQTPGPIEILEHESLVAHVEEARGPPLHKYIPQQDALWLIFERVDEEQ